MNKSLQKHVISKKLEKHGISADTVDLEALIDEKLSLKENFENIAKQLKLSTNDIPLDDDFEEQKNEELLREYMRVNGFDPDLELAVVAESELADLEEEIKVHNEQIEQILSEIVEKKDALETFSKYLFPELVGDQYSIVRKAILLLLATHRDLRKRTRIHILLYGPPGSGKTEILLWLRKLGAYFVNAEYASKVGMSGDARGKEITPGVLAEAHGMVLCIDELDKMTWRDQSALLQAMEEGQYTIVKGKFRERFRAEVRVVAAANDISKIQKPLLDRFDFIIELKTPSKEERAKNVDKLVDSFFFENDVMHEDLVREYLSWIQNHEPSVENMDRVKAVMRAYLNLTQSDVCEKSYRSLELSILRIAYALAKLERKNITPKHIVRAIMLKDPTLSKEQVKYLTAIAEGKLS